MSEMDKLPGNSKTVPAVRTEQRAVQRAVRTVAKGKVLNGQKKTSLFGRVKDAFSGEDMDNMGTNIVEDIIIPTAFNAFLNSLGAIGDGIMGAFELALFPDSNHRGRRRRSYSGGYDYAERYRPERRRVDVDDDRDRPRGRELGRRERETHNFDTIGYTTYEKAWDVLEEMVDWLEEYGECPVKVYYSASGLSANAQDLYWGWTSLANAKPVRVPDRDYPWRLMLPKPVYLNDRRK